MNETQETLQLADKIQLYDFQEDCLTVLEDVLSLRSEDPRGQDDHEPDRALIVVPTGGGKTVIFSTWIGRFLHQHKGGKVLILAHRLELLEQASNTIENISGFAPSFEQGPRKALDYSQIVVGSVQTLQRERLEGWDTEHFDGIIIDEAHHAPAATYQNILEHFNPRWILGVTATPDRADKRALTKSFGKTVSYSISIEELIRGHLLSPIRVRMLPIRIDLSQVRKTGGDYAAQGLATEITPWFDKVLDSIQEHAKGRKILVFLPVVKASKKFRDMAEERGLRAAHVDGGTPVFERQRTIDDMKKGNLDLLCNVGIATEGTDIPIIDCVVVLRPTKSRSLLVQMLGRGLRLFPGKDYCLILDFLWQTVEHDICVPASLLEEDIDKARRIQAKAKAEGEDLVDLVDRTEGELTAANGTEEREESLRASLSVSGLHNKEFDGDPLKIRGVTDTCLICGYFPGTKENAKPMTASQMNYLTKALGIKYGAREMKHITCKGHAKRIIDFIDYRRSMGLATWSQVRLLRRYFPNNAHKISYNWATRIIGLLASNGWKMPYAICAEFPDRDLASNFDHAQNWIHPLFGGTLSTAMDHPGLIDDERASLTAASPEEQEYFDNHVFDGEDDEEDNIPF